MLSRNPVLKYRRESGLASIMSTGLLFSVISLGALVTLSMLFLNRYAPHIRVAIGVLGLAICFYALADSSCTDYDHPVCTRAS